MLFLLVGFLGRNSYVCGSSSICFTCCSYCSLSMTTVALPLSVGRMLIEPSSFKCLIANGCFFGQAGFWQFGRSYSTCYFCLQLCCWCLSRFLIIISVATTVSLTGTLVGVTAKFSTFASTLFSVSLSLYCEIFRTHLLSFCCFCQRTPGGRNFEEDDRFAHRNCQLSGTILAVLKEFALFVRRFQPNEAFQSTMPGVVGK